MSVIEVRDLHKRYGDVHAVRGVDLDIAEGEVFALLGPNGAGKSTTVEILEGHRTATSGTVRVLGMDPATAGRQYRDRIGIVLQQSGIEDELSVDEALSLYSSTYSDPADPAEVLDLVGLGDKGPERVKHLSGGQQRRIDLALGLIGRPAVLFLDEPTTGFDPAARRRSWEVLSGLRNLGTTILLTTHYMDEAQHLADRVGVIVGGRIVAIGTPAELLSGADDTLIRFTLVGSEGSDTPEPGRTSSALRAIPDIAGAEVRRDEDQVTIRVANPTEALHTVCGWAIAQGIELVGLSVDHPSLEDVYLELANEGTLADDYNDVGEGRT